MARRVTIVVVTYNCERHVERCFQSLEMAGLDGLDAQVIVVDNASSDATARRIHDDFPWVQLVQSDRNLGFAGANNLAIRRAIEVGSEYVYLLNPDTEVHPDFLREALAVADGDPYVAAVQSLLLLAAEPDRINTAGNCINFLGFGFCGQFGQPRTSAPVEPVDIPFASGAAALLSCAALEEVGAFDELLFLYQEDMDLGWRLRLGGYHSVLAPRSVVWHAYEFSRNTRKLYFVERNRYIVLAKNLSLRSLLVLSPFLLAAELAILAVAAGSGWLPEKLRADAECLRPATWRHVVRERRRIAMFRRLRDREVGQVFSPNLHLGEAAGGWLTRTLRVPMSLAWQAILPLLG